MTSAGHVAVIVLCIALGVFSFFYLYAQYKSGAISSIFHSNRDEAAISSLSAPATGITSRGVSKSATDAGTSGVSGISDTSSIRTPSSTEVIPVTLPSDGRLSMTGVQSVLGVSSSFKNTSDSNALILARNLDALYAQYQGKAWPTGTLVDVLFEQGKAVTVSIKTPSCAKAITVASMDKSDIVVQSITEMLARNGGFCAVYSAALSNIKHLALPVAEYSDDGGKTIKRDFLDKVANAGGTTANDADYPGDSEDKAMHSNYPHPTLTYDCSTTISSKVNPQAFCKRIQDGIKDDDDCEMTLSGPAGAHSVNITGITLSKDKKSCTITNSNTGDDQTKDGNNVPANPTTQTWSIGQKGIKALTSKNLKAWNGFGFTEARVFCCAVVNK